MKKRTQEAVAKQLKDLRKSGAVNDRFAEQSEKIARDNKASFVKFSSALILEGSDWGSAVESQLIEIESHIDQMVTSEREKEIEKLKQLTTQATYETIDQIINEPIFCIKDNFWQDINDPFN